MLTPEYSTPCHNLWKKAWSALDKYDLPADFSDEFLELYGSYAIGEDFRHVRSWKDHLSGLALTLGGKNFSDWEGLFYHRSSIERSEEGMNNMAYGELLWKEYLQDVVIAYPQDVISRHKDQFLKDLTDGHRYIPVDTFVYEEFKGWQGDNLLEKFMSQIAPHTDRVILWSKGDVEATGYQVVKIFCSDIVTRVQDIVQNWGAAGIPVQPRNGFDLWIMEDKVKKVEEYVASLRPEEGIVVGKPHSIVVIDDSRANLREVQQLSTPWARIIPVWAAYSREGKELFEKKPNVYAQEVLDLNGLRTPHHLFTQKGLFTDATVLVDFDGVWVNNTIQRIHQGLVTYAALEGAYQRLENDQKIGKKA